MWVTAGGPKGQHCHRDLLMDDVRVAVDGTNKSSGDIVWRCVQKTCNITIITNNEKTVLIRGNIKDHQHDEDNDEQKKELQKIRTAVKRKVIENVYEKPIKIIRKELSSIEDSQVCSSNINALRKSMYRERRKTLPTVPSSITDAIQKVKIASIENKSKENFVHVFEEDETIIVTCKTNLLFLNDNTETLLADGTFTYCPKHFFQQYTIHGLTRGHYVPLVFCFLPSKTLKCYILGAHTAARNVFKNIKIKACRFHLCQAWYRKKNSIPILHKEYKDKNSEIGKWLKMFFRLPYLPENLVSDAFNDILFEAPKHKKCSEFANYILENYIDTEQFPPTMWAEEPNGTKRTTNGAESYHSQLRFEFYMPHPSVFQVIDVLIDQQVINEAQMREIKKGTEAVQRKCDREREANLVYQYSLLLTNNLTVMEYIEKSGLHFKPI
ncbi:hypothetical protein AGLY_002014 [Aphis glycines]|uniref:MULE transposase domain-containing protein n=1 Tax=Aphis glycines TaxID=307491 RepID=A0A6G0U3Y0_APHGL|nr:hypothetical protein AGLY_002014 [Aphis glycines]